MGAIRTTTAGQRMNRTSRMSLSLTIGRHPIASLAAEDKHPYLSVAAGAQHAGDDDCRTYPLRLTVDARRSDAGS